MPKEKIEYEQSHRIELTSSQVDQNGEFEILAITAGDGNGWNFCSDVLIDSLPLWEGAETFIDHHWYGQSVHDLAGICYAPTWDADAHGIKLSLRPVGPSAPILTELGRQMLADGEKPKVGFSADLVFTANGKDVEQILRKLVSVQQQLAELNSEAEKARDMRIRIGEQFLESALAAAKLPAPVAERVRKQFCGTLFEAQQLTDAIEDARDLVSQLTGGTVVSGPAIHSVFDTADKLQAAADDLLGAPRDAGKESLKVAKLSGIRELYLMLTGDYDLHGGFDAERIQLATTADFTGLVKNALNKIVVNTWDQLGQAGYDWWARISRVEHFNSLNTVTGTLVGTVGTLPEVSEGAEYTELPIGDSPETADFTKYGGYIPLTLELIDRDMSRKLAAYPRELAAAGLRKISALVSALFTANAGVGPTMADTGALFNNTAVTTAGGHANLLTTALAAAAWDTACTAVYDQPMLIKQAAGYYGTGPKMAINPRFLLVPRALQLTAMKILYPSLENAANIYSENQQRGQPGDVITVPEWTDATDWAAVCDPLLAPAIYVGERFGIMPEIFIAGDSLSPAVFMNDEHRLKVRHFLAVWVNDFRPLHKSNVAG